MARNTSVCNNSCVGIRSTLKENIGCALIDHYVPTVIQICDFLFWTLSAEPFVLVMEFVSYGTLRGFVQAQHEKLSADPELQSLFAIASYHIALAMEHLRSKMVGQQCWF